MDSGIADQGRTPVRKAKIGLVQVKAKRDPSIEERQQHLLELAEQCLQGGADLVFMTESYQYDRLPKEQLLGIVPHYAKIYKDRCSELARRYKAYVAPWDFETDSQGHLYNTSYILDRSGREIGRYRKTHLTWSETDTGLTRGTEFPVFDLDFGKVGIMICYDNYFPEPARALGVNGAELILYPLFDDTWDPQWEIRTRCRAIDNLAYVAPCKLGGGVAFTGMINPLGEVVCKVDAEGTCQVVDIELGKRQLNPRPIRGHWLDVRKYWEQSRNVEAYRALLKVPIPYKREEYVLKQDDVKAKQGWE